MSSLNEKAAKNLSSVRSYKPLIHNITNYVVMNFTANTLLAMGASPVMAHAENEVEDMVAFAGSLVINIGTLSDSWIVSMKKACNAANGLGTPVVLDPVGSGATPLRTETAKDLITNSKIDIIRGNASEILSLRDDDSVTKGVDSLHTVEEAAETAKVLAAELQTTLAITGPVDLITDGRRVVKVHNGHELLPSVTGTGCAATAAIGAFAAVDNDMVTACSTALAYFGLAGEKAAAGAQGPGSFMINLQDALYTLGPEDLLSSCRFEEL